MSGGGFLDNLALIGTVVDDLGYNLNPFGEGFLSGDAPATALMAEIQNAQLEGRAVDPERARLSGGLLTDAEEKRAAESNIDTGLSLVGDAARKTASDVVEKVGDVADSVAKVGSGGLAILSNPWALGGVALLVVGAMTAPYWLPLFRPTGGK